MLIYKLIRHFIGDYPHLHAWLARPLLNVRSSNHTTTHKYSTDHSTSCPSDIAQPHCGLTRSTRQPSINPAQIFPGHKAHIITKESP